MIRDAAAAADNAVIAAEIKKRLLLRLSRAVLELKEPLPKLESLV